MAIKTLQIAVPDGAVKDASVASDAAIAQSKVSGLVAALQSITSQIALLTPDGNVEYGSGAPGSGVGQNGDSYVDQAAVPPRLYGPKANGAWPGSYVTLGGSVTPPIVQGGNLGASSTLTMQATDVGRWLVGTLTANQALTVAGLVAGQTVRLLLTQDATGARTLTVNGATVPVVATANASFIVEGFYDGTDLYIRGAV